MNTKKAYELIQNILSGLPEKSKQSVLNKLFSNEKSSAKKIFLTILNVFEKLPI